MLGLAAVAVVGVELDVVDESGGALEAMVILKCSRFL